MSRSSDEHEEWTPGHIRLPAKAPPEDVCHELGHEVEYRLRQANPAATRRLDAFHKGRFPRAKDVRLAARFPGSGYAPDDPEAAYYAGKRYAGGMTEVVTTGLELLWLQPKAFAEADPDYFNLLTGLLRGEGG